MPLLVWVKSDQCTNAIDVLPKAIDYGTHRLDGMHEWISPLPPRPPPLPQVGRPSLQAMYGRTWTRTYGRTWTGTWAHVRVTRSTRSTVRLSLNPTTSQEHHPYALSRAYPPRRPEEERDGTLPLSRGEIL